MWHRHADRAILSFALLALAILLVAAVDRPAAAGTLKIGVLKFGTVNWELDVIKSHGLDTAEGVELEILALANKQATSIAFQAGEADMIVTDWIWVSRLRAEGEAYTFVPYSKMVGALMVPGDSPIESLDDLKGKRVGIAGGPVDKSWLLIRGLAERSGLDLDAQVDKIFGAPPLLNQQILTGELDAVVNFWHFNARLEAAGFRRLVEVDKIAAEFGVESEVPLIGYVFDEALAASQRDDILGFVRASRKAKEILRTSDAEWERLRPLMKAKNDATFQALRDNFRLGIPNHWGDRERADAGRIFRVLAKLGGNKLVGRSTALQDGTFWADVVY